MISKMPPWGGVEIELLALSPASAERTLLSDVLRCFHRLSLEGLFFLSGQMIDVNYQKA